MFQHRKYPRLSKNCQITYRYLDAAQFANSPIASLALNISGGGLCFETTEALEKDDMVALSIHSEDFRPILALIKVVWCKANKARYNVGAEFLWVGWNDPKAQQTIADYVANQTLCSAAV